MWVARVAACGVCLCAWSSAARAYRTAADLPEFTDGVAVGWAGGYVRYYSEDYEPYGLGQQAIDLSVESAFRRWEEVACTSLDVSYGGATSSPPSGGDGRVTVAWEADWVAQGFSPTAAATTDLVYALDAEGNWRIVDADIYLNELGFAWSTAADPPVGTRQVGAVVTHEAGHALGLLHPCEEGGVGGAPDCFADPSYELTTMYPRYTGSGQAELAEDDQAGICFLYPMAPAAPLVCPDGLIATADGCRYSCGGFACEAGEICVASSCVTNGCGVDPCPEPCVGDSCPLLGWIGDPCGADEDCLSDRCGVDGYCTQACIEGVCPLFAFECTDVGDECVAPAAVFGEACASGADCLSELCLGGDVGQPFCTRACQLPQLSCPAGYACGDVDGASVCVPRGATGCSLATAPTSGSAAWLSLLVVAVSILSRRRPARARLTALRSSS